MIHPAFKLSFAALAASCLSPTVAQSPPPETQQAFARPQHLVDIGARRMHLYCSATGPVTVVFDAYSGGAGSSWFAVQPHVAKRTRACVYDRAGLGFSDPAPRPGTSANAVEDLHQLLKAAGIAPPYVMVGSSYGGANMQLYAYRYPAEVAGLVLVEPQHEDDMARLDKVTDGKMGQMMAMNVAMITACRDQSLTGFSFGSEMATQCLGRLGERSATLAASDFAQRSRTSFWNADLSENTSFAVSGDQLRMLRKPFGSLPLIVLSRGVSP